MAATHLGRRAYLKMNIIVIAPTSMPTVAVVNAFEARFYLALVSRMILLEGATEPLSAVPPLVGHGRN